jgi:hypothetical protein
VDETNEDNGENKHIGYPVCRRTLKSIAGWLREKELETNTDNSIAQMKDRNPTNPKP